MSVHVKKRVADEHEAASLRRRRGKSALRTKARLENERSRERVLTWIALARAEELERERLHGCGADIWPLRPAEGRYEETW